MVINMSHKFIKRASVLGVAAFVYYKYSKFCQENDNKLWRETVLRDKKALEFKPTRRKTMLDEMKQKGSNFDILVIGGGATGLGCTLDAAVRGLRVACVERGDFASETSSKSTKLVHGGVRYLEKAIKSFDYSQYLLVKEALRERFTFLKIAPHLSHELPILLPVYSWAKVPYFWIGSKVYDLLSGKNKLSGSYFVTKEQTKEEFPNINEKGLCGSIVYFDGQQNDSRMAMALAMTSVYYGANVANYVEVKELLKSSDGKVIGAKVLDQNSGEIFDIHAKCVVNATGPFSDEVKKLDDPNAIPLICASSGTHIVLPEKFGFRNMGLIDPCTQDGRVVFVLPWEGRIIAGTTDELTTVHSNPLPRENEISFIIGEVNKNLKEDIAITKSDILAAWSGIRPLILNPESKNSESLVRSHLLEISKNGLVSISGGKWTTYRSMAEETVDFCVGKFNLNPKVEKSQTSTTPLIGSHMYSKSLAHELESKFSISKDVSNHLVNSYGDRAEEVLKIEPETYSKLLVSGFPYLEAEVKYAVRNEYAITIADVIGRRLRLSFLDVKACESVVDRVGEIMSKEMSWTNSIKEKQIQKAKTFLESMGSKIL